MLLQLLPAEHAPLLDQEGNGRVSRQQRLVCRVENETEGGRTMTISALKIWIRTKHSERELKHALHLIDEHREALEDALERTIARNLRGGKGGARNLSEHNPC